MPCLLCSLPDTEVLKNISVHASTENPRLQRSLAVKIINNSFPRAPSSAAAGRSTARQLVSLYVQLEGVGVRAAAGGGGADAGSPVRSLRGSSRGARGWTGESGDATARRVALW